MNHALIVLQFVACRRQLGLGFTNFIIKSTQTAAMRWIGEVHLVVLELRELSSCEMLPASCISLRHPLLQHSRLSPPSWAVRFRHKEQQLRAQLCRVLAFRVGRRSPRRPRGSPPNRDIKRMLSRCVGFGRRPFCCSLRNGWELRSRGPGRPNYCEPTTGFYAIYSKPADPPQLILHRRRPTKDHALIARARQAANDKARELGWIM